MKTKMKKHKLLITVTIIIYAIVSAAGRVQAEPSSLEVEYRHTESEARFYLKLPMYPLVIRLSRAGFWVWKRQRRKNLYNKRNRPW